MTDSVRRITWTSKTYAGYRGVLITPRAELYVADIDWGGVKRNDPTPWKLRMKLPGFIQEREFLTPENAQETAERILLRFVEIIEQSREGVTPS